MKQFMTFFLCICICVVFSACGKSDVKDDWSQGTDKQTSSNIESIFCENSEELKKELNGTTIVSYDWRDPVLSSINITVREIYDDYGITYKTILVSRLDYVQNILSDMAAGKQVDLIFSQDNFPKILSILQPISVTGIDLNSPQLNTAIIKASTVNGETYLVDKKGNLNDRFSVCVYNKKLFEQAGIPMPTEYFEKNEWTIDKFMYAARKISALGKNIHGVDVLPSAIYGFGGRLVKFDGKTFSPSDTTRFSKTNKIFRTLYDEGVLNLGRADFGGGNVGMALTDLYGLSRTGYFTMIDPESIGVTLFPKFDGDNYHRVSSPILGWGIAKNSTNPKAVGVMMMHYLDLINQPVDIRESHDIFFFNDEINEFYNSVLLNYTNRVEYYYDVSLAYSTNTNMDDLNGIWYYKEEFPDIDTSVSATKNKIIQLCNEANELLE